MGGSSTGETFCFHFALLLFFFQLFPVFIIGSRINAIVLCDCCYSECPLQLKRGVCRRDGATVLWSVQGCAANPNAEPLNPTIFYENDALKT